MTSATDNTEQSTQVGRMEPPPERVLVVKLADLGDVLTSTPALRALRETYPDSQIDILVTPGSAPALEGVGLVNNVLVFNKFRYDRPSDAFHPASITEAIGLGRRLRKGHYDALLILHHLTLRFGRFKYAALSLATGAPVRAGLDNGTGWFLTHKARDAGFGAVHEVEYWLDVAATLGARASDRTLAGPISPEAEIWADQLLERLLGRDSRSLVIHPGSGGYSLARRWLPERFATVAKHLRDAHGMKVILVGTARDNVAAVMSRIEGPALDLSERTSVPQLSALLRRASLFIGSDSGVMHLAAAAGTPLVAIFGPSNADAWGPWTSPNQPACVLRSGESCQPCSYVRTAIGRRDGCPERHCMYAVNVEMVIAAVEKVLRASGEGIGA